MQAHHCSHFTGANLQGPVPRPAGCPAARNQSVIFICQKNASALGLPQAVQQQASRLEWLQLTLTGL